jgi:hypothetical protein
MKVTRVSDILFIPLAKQSPYVYTQPQLHGPGYNDCLLYLNAYGKDASFHVCCFYNETVIRLLLPINFDVVIWRSTLIGYYNSSPRS